MIKLDGLSETYHIGDMTKERRTLPSVERLRHLFDYNPLTGVLRWRDLPEIQGKVRGLPASCITSKGYVTVQVDGVRYMAHRVCWKIYHGVEPPVDLDHEDRDRSNNRLRNLRVATDSENKVNANWRVNRSGLPQGVYFYVKQGRYAARVSHNGKRIMVGSDFITPEDAHAAYLAKRAELYGEFARVA